MRAHILPEAAGEAAAAAVWYENRQSGLGDEFLADWQQSLETIGAHPEGSGKLEYYTGPHLIRRCFLSRFPYVVIYLCRPDELLVIAVAHSRRLPLYWLDRLTD